MTLEPWTPWIWLGLTMAGLLLGGHLLMKLYRFEQEGIDHAVAGSPGTGQPGRPAPGKLDRPAGSTD